MGARQRLRLQAPSSSAQYATKKWLVIQEVILLDFADDLQMTLLQLNRYFHLPHTKAPYLHL